MVSIFLLNYAHLPFLCRHTLEAMRVIGLSQELIDNVLRLVACVLHLGNITFQNSSSDEAMVGEEHAMQAMEAVAALLGVSAHTPT